MFCNSTALPRTELYMYGVTSRSYNATRQATSSRKYESNLVGYISSKHSAPSNPGVRNNIP